MEQLKDKRGRHISYVRISLTDRCNYRCQYCMPPEGIPLMEHEDILPYEDVLFLLRSFWEMGIKKVRFTGGEVFVRKGFMDFLAQAREALEEMHFTITTNGHFLEEHASRLRELRVSGVNISLDTLNPEKFREITRCGDLNKVLQGIDAVRRENLDVKINTVLMQGFNDKEINDLIDFSRRKGVTLRFIEFMPLDDSVWGKDAFCPSEEIFSVLPDPSSWKRLKKDDHSAGPAEYFIHEKTGQKLGIIAAVSHHFCNSCNRLRITASGEVKPCLFSEALFSLKDALASRNPEAVWEVMHEAFMAKPENWQNLAKLGHCHMSSIGG